VSKTRLASAIVAVILPAIAFSGATAGTFTVYGPRNHPGEVGRSSPVVEGFSVTDPSAEYVLRVTRHDRTGPRVRINGVLVVRASDFSEMDQVIERPVDLSADNEISLSIVGNPHGTVTLEVYGIDEVPPVIDFVITPDPNAAGWHNRDATVTFECGDATSGIAQCAPPVVVREEGAGRTVSGLAVDRAGNRTMTTATVHLDKTPPVIEPATPSGQGPVLELTGIARDPVSGIEALECDGAAGEVGGGEFRCALRLASGGNAITVEAIDRAGNRTRTGAGNVIHEPPLTTEASVVITSPANLSTLGASEVPGGVVTVAGTVRAQALGSVVVEIDGVTATVSERGATDQEGIWDFIAEQVAMKEGRNLLTATAFLRESSSPSTDVVRTASVLVTLDTTAPDVIIDTPVDGASLAGPTVTVAGRLIDPVVPVVRRHEPRVVVNGIEAMVSNGTFVAYEVPLKRGPNTISAEATDDAGNSQSDAVTVSLVEVVGQQIRAVSGDRQNGEVGTTLSEPLLVSLTDAGGKPIVNRPVEFRVTRGDGTVGDGISGGRKFHVFTDGEGEAEVWLTLGTRSGSGNQRVTATAIGFAGEARFAASASPGVPDGIKSVSGVEQYGVVHGRLPEPFIVFVHDAAGNPVPKADVQFVVESGGGAIDGRSLVPTGLDGRAAAYLTLGSTEGTNTQMAAAYMDVSDDATPPQSDPDTGPLPVGFFATARQATSEGTTLGGVVLDQSDGPVPEATVRVHHPSLTIPRSTTTDDAGEFDFADIPVGRLVLEVEGGTTTLEGNWPTLVYDVTTVPGNDNILARPVNLVELDESSEQVLGGDAPVSFSMTAVPGLELVVAAQSATCPGLDSCTATLTQVHADRLPVTPPRGASPRLAWTLQPEGIEFDPPARLIVPNVDSLRPGQVVDLFAFDEISGEFVPAGTGAVADDGSVIEADPGAGLVRSGWAYLAAPPPPASCVFRCDDGDECTDDTFLETCACTHVANTGECFDGLYCTTGDSCATGRCVGQALPDEEPPALEPYIGLALDFSDFREKLGDTGEEIAGALEETAGKGPCRWGNPFDISIWLNASQGEGKTCCESMSPNLSEGEFEPAWATVDMLSGDLGVSWDVAVCEWKGEWWIFEFEAKAGLRLFGELQMEQRRSACIVANEDACKTDLGAEIGLELFGTLNAQASRAVQARLDLSASAYLGFYLEECDSGDCDELPTFQVDLGTCDGSIDACVGKVKISGRVKLFAFVSVGVNFDIIDDPWCVTIVD
jgi:hypothetical protein